MKNKTARRGASARIVGIMASATMLAAGLAGVAFAGSASAVPGTPSPNDPNTVCGAIQGWNPSAGYSRITGGFDAATTYGEDPSVTTDAEPEVNKDEDPDNDVLWTAGTSGTWTSTKTVLAVLIHAGVNDTVGSGTPGTSGTWATGLNPEEKAYQAVSTITFCFGGGTEPDSRTIYNCAGSTTQTQVWDSESQEYVYEELPAGYSLTPPSAQSCATAQSRTIYNCAGSTTQTQVWDSESQEYVYEELPAGYSLTPPSAQSCSPTVVTENPTPPVETTPVVEAAVVSAPEAATVPAPATVSVPAAAKLPAAVPAGDGSQAPGLPLWALALLAMGLLGAGFSAKGLLTARK